MPTPTENEAMLSVSTYSNWGYHPQGSDNAEDGAWVGWVDGNGDYTLLPGASYGPEEPTWTYVADPPTDFYAQIMSGAQRLPNGNTLVCAAPFGTFFEVTEAGETVWLYVNPTSGEKVGS